MYAGFLMYRPSTNSTASVLFDTHMVDYMEDAKRLLAVCETMLEQENPDVDPEVVCTTIKDAANEMALKIEKITREFRVNGWEYHSLIDQD